MVVQDDLVRQRLAALSRLRGADRQRQTHGRARCDRLEFEFRWCDGDALRRQNSTWPDSGWGSVFLISSVRPRGDRERTSGTDPAVRRSPGTDIRPARAPTVAAAGEASP